jgi:hypothetical protein
MAVPTQGIKYAAEDGPSVGRGLAPMGGVPAITNPLPMPVVPKNGAAEDILGDNEINAGVQPQTPILERYANQPIPSEWPQR